jgi:hypothetical protein
VIAIIVVAGVVVLLICVPQLQRLLTRAGRSCRSPMKRLLLVAVMLAGCASNRAASTTASTASTMPVTTPTPTTLLTPTTPTTLTTVDLQTRYLSMLAPFNQATETFRQQLQSGPQNPTGPQVAAMAGPYIKALYRYQEQLGQLPVPPSMAAHRSELVDDVGQEGTDLESLVAAPNASDWFARFSADVNKSHAATDTFRADLGLPPAPVS